jgi:hypothetical protein
MSVNWFDQLSLLSMKGLPELASPSLPVTADLL